MTNLSVWCTARVCKSRLLAAVLFAAAGALAGASSAGSAVLRHRPAWSAHGEAQALLGNGRYVFTQDGNSAQLITAATGRRRSLTVPAGCSPSLMSGSVLLFECATSPYATGLRTMLQYSLPAGAWAGVQVSPPVLRSCDQAPEGVCRPVAIGTQWIEFDESSCQDGEHCSDTTFFQSLHSDDVEDDPVIPGQSTYVNLDSTALTEKLCRPVTAPADWTAEGEAPGTLSRYGRFYISDGTDRQGDQETYLERCGSRLHALLQERDDLVPPTGNSRQLIWQDGARAINGITLPTQRRFTVAPPSSRSPITALQLAGSRLYALAGGRLWTAAAPRTTGHKSR